jgi:hypothetical protein
MNTEMSYLLGMICGNGEIKRGNSNTIFSIEIPHKKLKTDDFQDIKLYVKASITDIRTITEPLIGAGINFIQNKSATVLSFSKPNSDYLTREILQYIGMATSHNDAELHDKIFQFTNDEKRQFLKGFADVTGYIRRSNYFFKKYMHRVYLEIPYNWEMVVGICNLLKDLHIPVQNIDWAHPNMRDPKLKKYNEGKHSFWKKEHQIKIYANEFLPIGFGVIHKQQALEILSTELIAGINTEIKANEKSKRKNKIICVADRTHKYCWETKSKKLPKPEHPCVKDEFIPLMIRGKHYNSWKEIAEDLGYDE